LFLKFKSFFRNYLSLSWQSKVDVVFYYPRHFNRSIRGNNPYFEPLTDACKQNGLSFILIEEPDTSTNHPKDLSAIPFDFYLVLILVFRKLLPLSFFQSFESREHKIARILKPVFFRKLEFKVFITISNSMLGFFRGLSPEACLFDYQHGIINSSHPGYVIDRMAAPHIKQNNVSVLMYGTGFQDILNRSDSGYYLEHTRVIGLKNRQIEQFHKAFNRNVLVTLQFTAGEYLDFQQYFFQFLTDLFEKHSEFFVDQGIRVFLKNHPRYDGVPDIAGFGSFPFVEFTQLPNDKCYELCSINLTYHSTSIFEAAHNGLPTYIINDKLSNSIYFDEFDFPVKNDQHFIDFLLKIMDANQYHKLSAEVKNWNSRYYMQFDEPKFISLLKGCL
jgi:hypothetical protein